MLPLCPVMIALGLRIHVPPGKRDEVQRIFRSLLEPARVRGGCLACRAYQDTEEPDVLALMQEWANSDALERYLRTEDFRRLVAVMELASERPEIWFDTIETREGLERLSAGLSTAAEQERP